MSEEIETKTDVNGRVSPVNETDTLFHTVDVQGFGPVTHHFSSMVEKVVFQFGGALIDGFEDCLVGTTEIDVGDGVALASVYDPEKMCLKLEKSLTDEPCEETRGVIALGIAEKLAKSTKGTNGTVAQLLFHFGNPKLALWVNDSPEADGS
jgi:hypothetical protein